MEEEREREVGEVDSTLTHGFWSRIEEQPLHVLSLSTLRNYLKFEFADFIGRCEREVRVICFVLELTSFLISLSKIQVSDGTCQLSHATWPSVVCIHACRQVRAQRTFTSQMAPMDPLPPHHPSPNPPSWTLSESWTMLFC